MRIAIATALILFMEILIRNLSYVGADVQRI
jgi:hypothetical protein